ncbi:hypothetical protein IAU59_006886 [Kwoniella sp. CBS 9459]
MKGFTTASLVGLAAWLGHVQVAAEAGVYLSIDNVKATVYYDLVSGGKCDAVHGAGWGLVHGNNPSACEAARGSTYVKEGVANAVAMNRNFVDRDLVDFCGRIVKVYKPNGEEYKLPNGLPFFIWDGCEHCATEERIDLGAEAIADLQDVGTDSGGNPTGCDNPLGLKVEIMNEYFWQLEPHGVVNESPGPVADPNAVYPLPTPTKNQPNGLPSEYRNLPPGVSAPVQTGANASASAGGGGQAPNSYGTGQATSMSSTASSVDPSVSSTGGSAGGGGNSSNGTSSGSASSGTAGAESSTYAPPPVVPTGSPGIVAVADGSPGTGATAPSSTQTSSSSASAPGSAVPSAPPVSGNGTTNSDGSVASQSQGQKADCEAGEFMCEGLQLKVCNFIQPGMPDLGWVDHVTCQTVCDVECDFTCE